MDIDWCECGWTRANETAGLSLSIVRWAASHSSIKLIERSGLLLMRVNELPIMSFNEFGLFPGLYLFSEHCLRRSNNSKTMKHPEKIAWHSTTHTRTNSMITQARWVWSIQRTANKTIWYGCWHLIVSCFCSVVHSIPPATHPFYGISHSFFPNLTDLLLSM